MTTKRRRVIERATKEQAEGLAQRLLQEGKGVTLLAPEGTHTWWRVVVYYNDGEQQSLPLGSRDGPA